MRFVVTFLFIVIITSIQAAEADINFVFRRPTITITDYKPGKSISASLKDEATGYSETIEAWYREHGGYGAIRANCLDKRSLTEVGPSARHLFTTLVTIHTQQQAAQMLQKSAEVKKEREGK